MDKPFFIDYESKICSEFLNTVSNTVWDALGQAQTPQQARIFIGAVEEAPLDGKSYLRASGAWTSAETSLLHNSLGGRSLADAHPLDSITGLTSALAGKAPTVHTHVATEVSFSPSGTISATQVQAAIQELDSETQTALSGLAGDISALEAADAFNVKRTSATGAAHIPAGTTAQRDPVPQFGDQRANSDLTITEWWDGSAWTQLGGMAQAAAEAAFLQVDGGNQMIAPLVFDTSANALVKVGATNVAQFPTTCGIPFCKNKLFNGEVTRINQRAFDGNWAAKGTWAGGNTIAQQELCYGWDMWAKASATDMVQLIEAGNFRPSTVHTLSGIGVTEQQITSPASGNWAITVPQAARNIQVEEGAVATPFEMRPIGFEREQCERYFQYVGLVYHGEVRTTFVYQIGAYPRTTMRVTPICGSATETAGSNSPSNFQAAATSDIVVASSSSTRLTFARTATSTSLGLVNSYYGMSAVI